MQPLTPMTTKPRLPSPAVKASSSQLKLPTPTPTSPLFQLNPTLQHPSYLKPLLKLLAGRGSSLQYLCRRVSRLSWKNKANKGTVTPNAGSPEKTTTSASLKGRTYPVYVNGLTIYGGMPMSMSPNPITPEPDSAEEEKQKPVVLLGGEGDRKMKKQERLSPRRNMPPGEVPPLPTSPLNPQSSPPGSPPRVRTPPKLTLSPKTPISTSPLLMKQDVFVANTDRIAERMVEEVDTDEFNAFNKAHLNETPDVTMMSLTELALKSSTPQSALLPTIAMTPLEPLYEEVDLLPQNFDEQPPLPKPFAEVRP
ncbi:hypothetical protein BC829DRAFT_215100 [Chytridium lagenaria]|nr:hypothetical protein BC829DRAFT_215100 [Chytridium lagenaria]